MNELSTVDYYCTTLGVVSSDCAAGMGTRDTFHVEGSCTKQGLIGGGAWPICDSLS